MPSARSTAVRHLAYTAAKQELYVFFRGGDNYTYFDVPADAYEALMEAPSKGGFINRQIKGHFRSTRRDVPKRRILLEPRWPFQEKSA